MAMNETLRDTILEVIQRGLPYESWMTTEEYDQLIEDSIEQVGGWGALEKAVKEGEAKGISIAHQVSALNSVFMGENNG